MHQKVFFHFFRYFTPIPTYFQVSRWIHLGFSHPQHHNLSLLIAKCPKTFPKYLKITPILPKHPFYPLPIGTSKSPNQQNPKIHNSPKYHCSHSISTKYDELQPHNHRKPLGHHFWTKKYFFIFLDFSPPFPHISIHSQVSRWIHLVFSHPLHHT